jgi:uncharacterized protein (DUF433 family)
LVLACLIEQLLADYPSLQREDILEALELSDGALISIDAARARLRVLPLCD